MAIEIATLSKLLELQAARYGTHPFLRHKRDRTWQELSWTEVATAAQRIRTGLIQIGLGHGDRIAILAENSPEWVLVDQAALGLGAIVVPLYTTSGIDEMRHVLTDSGATVVAIGNSQLMAKLEALGPLTALKAIIAMHEDADGSWPGIAILSLRRLAESAPTPAMAGHPEDLATLIYTSGTTGPPKGVMLSHGNILANCDSNQSALDLNEKDSVLSFLPIAHSFERTAGYYTVMRAGGMISYAEGLSQLAHNLLEVEPTVLLTVPRLLETVYDRIMRRVQSSSKAQQVIFHHAIAVGDRSAEARLAGDRAPIMAAWQMPLCRRLVFNKIKAAFGSRLRYLISGGAPLPLEINRFFNAAEVPIVEGYGLTEASPVVAVNLSGRTRLGTVGRPLKNIDVRLADDGELLVHGPNVMQGYWGRADETRESLDSDGWLHTGDIAKLDADGYITITDRKKELIVLSGGKNVSPANLESRLTADFYIAQACVIGDRRKHLAALLVPNFDHLREHQGKALGLDNESPEAIVGNPKIRDFFRRRLREFNRPLSEVEAIVDFCLIAQPFSQENGELTPTLKLRRRTVQEHYRNEIETLFGG
jgi:long-chain acyl-CoA synthetase